MQPKQVTKKILVQTNLFDLIKNICIKYSDVIFCAVYWLGCIGISELIIHFNSHVSFLVNGIDITKRYIDVLTLCNYINGIFLIGTVIYIQYYKWTTISNGIDKNTAPVIFLSVFISMAIKGGLCFPALLLCDDKCRNEISSQVKNLDGLFLISNMINFAACGSVLAGLLMGLLAGIGVVFVNIGYMCAYLLKKVQISYVKEYQSDEKVDI